MLPSHATSSSGPAPVRPTQPHATLMLANANVLNLAPAGMAFYPNQRPYSEAEAARKTAWLGAQIARLNADVLAVQEVWHEAALRAAVAASGLRYSTVLAPGAENGASGTPSVGLATRLPLRSVESLSAFEPGCEVPVPDLPPQTRFERPVLHATLALKEGLPLNLLVVHLKSKRPKFLQDAAGAMLEDADDPGIVARATLRSLAIRAAEAAALRALVLKLAKGRQGPLVLMGDMNDSPHSVTTQMIAATQAVAFDRQARDVALFHALDVQVEPLKRDVLYSHVHQGWPELLDQIWVSEELVASSRFSIGDIKRVEVFNDHLQEPRDGTRSDHGFVRALLRLRKPEERVS
jgi:endonuclease/exonuclease/phosphatase family metal-dependent hydrolase